ncbi:uncharacterized protein LOC127282152 [Leptopilina boulardi]|uniref:uncharacterized protein LOC127282152 n=1 Tax=Leptopilina boulardi TaxID=63433 RepID=UPI0021F61C3D|nr:uncharacterized protein LOC127282152 [Leptopilina boulardi]
MFIIRFYCILYFLVHSLKIYFGEWEPARERIREDDFWPYDATLAIGQPKIYAAQSWYQEYHWCEESQKYFVRGFWAPQGFRSAIWVHDSLPRLKIVFGGLGQGKAPQTCFFKDLPLIPQEVGCQPALSAMKLSFLQCHDWQGTSPRTRGWWKLRLNVDHKFMFVPMAREHKEHEGNGEVEVLPPIELGINEDNPEN